MRSFEAFTKNNVLREFKRFLPIITAFHSENFNKSNWRNITRSIFYVACATSIVVFLAYLAIFATWYLIENGVDLKMIVAALPIVFGLVNNAIAFISMVIQSRTICETITQIGSVVDQRESFDLSTLF